jgi:hypothetical protein
MVKSEPSAIVAEIGTPAKLATTEDKSVTDNSCSIDIPSGKNNCNNR